MNETLLQKCDEVWVLNLDGWRESVGVSFEVNWAVSHHLPIRFVDVKGNVRYPTVE